MLDAGARVDELRARHERVPDRDHHRVVTRAVAGGNAAARGRTPPPVRGAMAVAAGIVGVVGAVLV